MSVLSLPAALAAGHLAPVVLSRSVVRAALVRVEFLQQPTMERLAAEHAVHPRTEFSLNLPPPLPH